MISTFICIKINHFRSYEVQRDKEMIIYAAGVKLSTTHNMHSKWLQLMTIHSSICSTMVKKKQIDRTSRLFDFPDTPF